AGGSCLTRPYPELVSTGRQARAVPVVDTTSPSLGDRPAATRLFEPELVLGLRTRSRTRAEREHRAWWRYRRAGRETRSRATRRRSGQIEIRHRGGRAIVGGQ